jgi:anhydro-N-acetylmuramic acid kinase
LVSVIERLKGKKSFLAAGLMSGTSMDGIDVALVRLTAAAESSGVDLVGFGTSPYPEELRGTLRDLAYGGQCSTEDLAVLHTGVAVAFANAFHATCRDVEVKAADVDFIGSHGQTVAHVPPTSGGTNLIAGTLQLGPPGMIAVLTGVMTVGDFRSADIALGGQGAPLAPYADYVLRRSRTQNRLILNIGGIANVTYLPANCSVGEVIAFDTGPGNMVVDELYRVLYPGEGSYDKLNELLTAAEPSHTLVERFLDMSYFGVAPPKSAGHREFGGRLAWEFLSQAESGGLRKVDTLASAVTLTTRSIHSALKAYVMPHGEIDEIFVTGGGSRNPIMMRELGMMFDPIVVRPIDDLGVPAEAKEAVDFAVLARESLLCRPNVLNAVTGASRASVLGTIALGA